MRKSFRQVLVKNGLNYESRPPLRKPSKNETTTNNPHLKSTFPDCIEKKPMIHKNPTFKGKLTP